MEIKLTADKKLLDALSGIAAALEAALKRSEPVQTASMAPVAASTLPPDKLAAPEAKPEEALSTPSQAMPESEPAPPEAPEAPEAPVPAAPTRDEVRQTAVVKIQAGLGPAVKALVTRYGAARVGDVPEERLAEFLAELEALA